MSKHKLGQVSWVDLTVKNAEQVRDFYKEIVGWNSSEVDMGGYSDFNMNLEDGKTIAGICHSRGLNANLPAQWLIYITVSDLEKSLVRCRALGGKIVDGPRSMGESRFCVIQDPSGAVAALWQQ
jgi:hypothetical protein